MARIRTIKPDAWQDRRLGEVSRDARLLWVVLITQADDAGRFRAFAPTIWGHGYVHDPDALGLIPGWLAELDAAGLIRLYQVDGEEYGDLPRWSVHQKISKPTPSRLPEFTGIPGEPGATLGFPAQGGGPPRVSRAGRDKEKEEDKEDNAAREAPVVVIPPPPAVSEETDRVCDTLGAVGLHVHDRTAMESLLAEFPDVDGVEASIQCANWARGKRAKHPLTTLRPFLAAPDARRRGKPPEGVSKYDEGTIEGEIS